MLKKNYYCLVAGLPDLLFSESKQGYNSLDFRNELHFSTLPENKPTYRNYKRRIGKVSYIKGEITEENNTQAKHIPGPYWLSVRKKWLEQLKD